MSHARNLMTDQQVEFQRTPGVSWEVGVYLGRAGNGWHWVKATTIGRGYGERHLVPSRRVREREDQE